MSSYQINPPSHVGECANCGQIQEDVICEDCMAVLERQSTAILDFYAALPADLQRAFDTADGIFDGGHRVELYMRNVYKVFLPNGNEVITFMNCEWVNSFTLPELVQWCIANREVLQ